MAAVVLAPLQAIALPQQQQNDPMIEQLVAMFPDIDREVLTAVLDLHDGNADAAITTLLDQSSPSASPTEEASDAELAAAQAQAEQAALDAELAERAQQEMDESVARALQKDLEAEDAAWRAQQPAARAAAAGAAAVDKAKESGKKLMSFVRGRAPGARFNTDRAVRLLDDDGATAEPDGPVASPLLAAATLAPLYEAPLPVMQQSPASSGEPSPRGEPSLGQSTNARYASRVGRAKAANQAARRTTSTTSAPQSPVAAPAERPIEIVVPEGELI